MKHATWPIPSSGIEVTEIMTDQDLKSYTLGVSIAREVRANHVGVDFTLLMRGMRDALNGCPIVD